MRHFAVKFASNETLACAPSPWTAIGPGQAVSRDAHEVTCDECRSVLAARSQFRFTFTKTTQKELRKRGLQCVVGCGQWPTGLLLFFRDIGPIIRVRTKFPYARRRPLRESAIARLGGPSWNEIVARDWAATCGTEMCEEYIRRHPDWTWGGPPHRIAAPDDQD